jgi:hypothetical protein
MVQFQQDVDTFYLDTPADDVNSVTIGTSASSVSLASVPKGISVGALGDVSQLPWSGAPMSLCSRHPPIDGHAARPRKFPDSTRVCDEGTVRNRGGRHEFLSVPPLHRHCDSHRCPGERIVNNPTLHDGRLGLAQAAVTSQYFWHLAAKLKTNRNDKFEMNRILNFVRRACSPLRPSMCSVWG